jgi:hypothetical protein
MWWLISCAGEPVKPAPVTESDTDTDIDADTDTDTDGDTDTVPLPPGCGDLTCAAGESCALCPVDCGPCEPSCTPDALCAPATGETCPSCPQDCDLQTLICGNGHCQSGENGTSCMVDCGPPTWPLPWTLVEELVLLAINEERAAGTDCGTLAFEPAPALQMDATLRAPARLHSWDQSHSDYYDDTSCNDRELQARASTAQAEARGWGWPTPQAVVAAWVVAGGPECQALMNPTYTSVGVGFAEVGDDPLWTAVFR